jgi:hypothetical protein
MLNFFGNKTAKHLILHHHDFDIHLGRIARTSATAIEKLTKVLKVGARELLK